MNQNSTVAAATMRAVVHHRYGPPSVLEVSEVEVPRPGRGEVLVRVGAASVHPGDYFIMTGEVLIFSEIIENQSAIDYVIEKYFPDTPKESSSGTVAPQRIYSPIYRRPENGKLHLKPEYPPITPGSRNLSLTSLATSR